MADLVNERLIGWLVDALYKLVKLILMGSIYSTLYVLSFKFKYLGMGRVQGEQEGFDRSEDRGSDHPGTSC